MIDEIRELLQIVEKLPELTLWVLAGFGGYKLIIYLSTTGAMVVIARLAINKIHDAYTNPRAQAVEYKIRNHFIDEETMISLETLMSRLKYSRILGRHSSYIHANDVNFLIQAYDEKVARDKAEKK
jgi:hypothetical protein